MPSVPTHWLRLLLLCLGLLSPLCDSTKAGVEPTRTSPASTNAYDVLVVGGTPAGVAAAIAAARADARRRGAGRSTN